MSPSLFNYHSHFNCLIQLKLSPNFQDSVLDVLTELLTDSAKALNCARFQMLPCTSLGQYDVVFGLPGPTVPDTSRRLYAILDTLNICLPGALRDFYRSVLFEWDLSTLDVDISQYNPLSDNSEGQLLAYVTIKYQNLKDRTQYDKLAAATILNELNQIISDQNKYKSNKSHIHLKFRAFGSLSWNELILFCYGTDYRSVNNLCGAYRASEYTTSKKWNYVLDPTKKSYTFQKEMYIHTQVFPSSAFFSRTADKFLTKYNFTPKNIVWSHNHGILIYKPHNIYNFRLFFSELCSLPGLEYTNSSVYRSAKDIASENTYDSDKEYAPASYWSSCTNKNTLSVYKDTLNRIEIHSIPRRKLMAMKSEIEIIKGISDYKHIFQENITQSLDFLIDRVGQFSDETVQYYISEFSAALQDKIAGSQLDVIIGKDVGFLEQHGNYPRLTFACEAFFNRCLNIYLKHINKDMSSDMKPVLLAFFDYGSRLSNEMPPEIISRGIDINLPIVIRLNMSRYKPWLWAIGLRQLSKLVFLKDKFYVYQLVSEDPNVSQFGDRFIRQFFSAGNLARILQEELGFFKSQGKGQYLINPALEDTIIKRTEECEENYFHTFYCDDILKSAEVNKFKSKLRQGVIVFKMSNEDFINYINAYTELPRPDQAHAKCFVSFVVSLYWDLWKQRREYYGR